MNMRSGKSGACEMERNDMYMIGGPGGFAGDGEVTDVGHEETSGHTFQVDVMIVEDGLTAKRGPNFLCMGILITDGLSAEFVLECILWPEARLYEAVP